MYFNARFGRHLFLGAFFGLLMCLVLLLFLWFVDRGSGVNLLETIPAEASDDQASRFAAATHETEVSDPLGLTLIKPVPGSELTHFDRIRFRFPIPVAGLSEAGLTCNGKAALEIQGMGAGPYEIIFPRVNSGRVELVFENPNAIVPSGEEQVNVPTSWTYSLLPAGSQSLKIQALRLRVPDSYPSDHPAPKQFVSLTNTGDNPILTRGWILRGLGDETSGIEIPDRNLLPGTILTISLEDFSDSADLGGFIPNASRGRLRLFNADFPSQEMDAVPYRFSAAALNQTLLRKDDAWAYALGDVETAENRIAGVSLPDAPIPNHPPGRYQGPF